jgi:D-arabinose 1-dehydrogenase-like Zn-dependent alcohol dehydrogenase
MRAYQLLEWQQAPVLHDVPVPDPGPGQVLIRVAAAGACHSDLHIMSSPPVWSPSSRRLRWDMRTQVGLRRPARG